MALWSLLMAPAVALKVALATPAVTVTEAGTVSSDGLLFDRLTRAPPVGAALDSITVQDVEELLPTLDGLHDTEDTVGRAAVMVTVVLAVLLL